MNIFGLVLGLALWSSDVLAADTTTTSIPIPTTSLSSSSSTATSTASSNGKPRFWSGVTPDPITQTSILTISATIITTTFYSTWTYRQRRTNLGRLPSYAPVTATSSTRFTCTEPTAYLSQYKQEIDIATGTAIPSGLQLSSTTTETYLISYDGPTSTYTALILIGLNTISAGAGQAWRLYQVDIRAPEPTVSLPTSSTTSAATTTEGCFPSALISAAGDTYGRGLLFNFFSPAPECPPGFAKITSTVFTETLPYSDASTGTQETITETAAMCCYSGWSLEAEYYDYCTSHLTATQTVVTAKQAYLPFASPPAFVPTYITFANRTALYDLGIKIRWQESDLRGGPSPTATKKGEAGGRAKGDILWIHFFLCISFTVAVVLF